MHTEQHAHIHTYSEKTDTEHAYVLKRKFNKIDIETPAVNDLNHAC